MCLSPRAMREERQDLNSESLCLNHTPLFKRKKIFREISRFLDKIRYQKIDIFFFKIAT
jgi:hypothetical protein